MARSPRSVLTPEYLIQPRHFDTLMHSVGATGVDPDEEPFARAIINFCQERGESWGPFTQEEVEAYLVEIEEKPLDIYKIMKKWASRWLVYVIDEREVTVQDPRTGKDKKVMKATYILRHLFVAGCFSSAGIRHYQSIDPEAPREEEPAK